MFNKPQMCELRKDSAFDWILTDSEKTEKTLMSYENVTTNCPEKHWGKDYENMVYALRKASKFCSIKNFINANLDLHLHYTK